MSVKGRAAAYTPWIAIPTTLQNNSVPHEVQSSLPIRRVRSSWSPDEGDDSGDPDEEYEAREGRESDQPEDDPDERIARCTVEIVDQRAGLARSLGGAHAEDEGAVHRMGVCGDDPPRHHVRPIGKVRGEGDGDGVAVPGG